MGDIEAGRQATVSLPATPVISYTHSPLSGFSPLCFYSWHLSPGVCKRRCIHHVLSLPNTFRNNMLSHVGKETWEENKAACGGCRGWLWEAKKGMESFIFHISFLSFLNAHLLTVFLSFLASFLFNLPFIFLET